MEIKIKEFAFFIKMIQDKLDDGTRIKKKECLDMYRNFIIKIHEGNLEDLYPFLKECTVGGYKIANEDYIIIEDFMINSKKINAIKHMRKSTGIGLKEAKNAIEETFPAITDAINTSEYDYLGRESKWPAGTNI